MHTDLPPTGNATIFGRSGFFGYAVRPSGEMLVQQLRPTARAISRRAVTPGAQQVKQLLSIHRDDPPEVTRILQSVSGEIGAYAVYDLGSLPFLAP